MKDHTLTITSKRQRIADVYEFVLQADEDLPPIHAGQFLHLSVGEPYLLRRPFCIHKFTDRTVTIVVAVVGGGTRALAKKEPGDTVQAVLPIGNGFTLTPAHKKVVLLGGGVGCAPLATVPVSYPDRTYYSYLGFTTKDAVFMTDAFTPYGKTVVCTDDGSLGRAGYVTDVLEQDIKEIAPDVILTCGSTPMLKEAARLSVRCGVPAYMSGESRMGCGVGACLVCTCDIKSENGEIVRKRACVDGPVFDLKDIVL